MAFLGTFIVGSIFLISGGIKTLYSQPFIIHVQQLRLFSPRFGSLLAVLFIQFECGLGVGLAMHIYPEYLVPLSIFLLLFFSVLTAWGVKSKRVIDCGCFGNMIKLSISQSLISNLLFSMILLLVWLNPIEDYTTDLWKVGVMIFIVLLSSVLNKKSIQSPLVSFTYITKGKVWNSDWLPDSYRQIQQGTCFIVFLKTECSICKSWLPLLESLHNRLDMPDIIAVVPGVSEVEKFREINNVKFPISSMKPDIFRKRVYQTPSAILQSQGVIINHWVKDFPIEYL